jgi:hypothetical protein
MLHAWWEEIKACDTSIQAIVFTWERHPVDVDLHLYRLTLGCSTWVYHFVPSTRIRILFTVMKWRPVRGAMSLRV